MRSEIQNNQSRINGAKSKGPVTPRGKAQSSRNSLRHGLLARTVVLPGESRARFDDLLRSFSAAVLPADALECALVEKLTVSYWKQMRLWDLEKASFNPASADPAPISTLLNSYESNCERGFSRAFDRLLKLRAARNPKERTQEDAQNTDISLQLPT